jgi:bacillolysin
MKKNTLFLFFIFSTFIFSAQQVVSTQGDSYTGAAAKIDFTVGEVIVNLATDGTTTLTEGFHQTSWNFVSLENHVPTYEASIFPNPTAEILNIKTADFQGVTYSLYDGMGKLVLRDKLSSQQSAVQVSQLATGKYALILRSENQKLKTFQLIKTH